jgi:hypothetical protein
LATVIIRPASVVEPERLASAAEPVSTSSAAAPSASHAARTIGQYSGGGTSTPLAPGTGSRITAATERVPSSFIVWAMWVAHSRRQVSTRWPNGQRSQ